MPKNIFVDLAERCNLGMLPEKIEYSYNFVAVSEKNHEISYSVQHQ